MKKRFIKILSLILALLCVFPTITSCFKKSESNGGDSAFTPEQSENSTQPIDVTRAEFIGALIEAYGYHDEEIINSTQFTDISGHEYERHIEIAAQYGIISLDGDKFYPNSAATREFASNAAIKHLGYMPDTALDCADTGDIAEPEYAALAIDLGLLSLTDGKFLPNKALTAEEKDNILSIVTDTVNSISGPDGNEKGVLYKDGVIQLNEAESEILENDEEAKLLSLPVSAKLLNLNEGDIIVLENGYSYKVISAERADDTVIIGYTEPEIFEVFEYLDTAGSAMLSDAEFILADDITIEEITEEQLNEEGLSVQRTAAHDGSINTDFTERLKITLKLPHDTTVNAIVVINIEKVDYLIDFDTVDGKIQIKDFQMLLDLSQEVSGTITREKDLNGSNAKTTKSLGTWSWGGIQLPNGTFLGGGIAVELKIEINAEGSISFAYETSGTWGYHLVNGKIRQIKEMKSGFKNLAFSGEFGVTPMIEASLRLFNRKLAAASLGITFGFSGTFKLQDIDPLFFCLSGEAGIYFDAAFSLSVGYDKKDYDDANYGLQFEYFLRVPIVKKSGHWENFTSFVKECTYGDEEPDDPPSEEPLPPDEPLPPENNEDPPIDVPPPAEGTCNIVLRITQNFDGFSPPFHNIDRNDMILGLRSDEYDGQMIYCQFRAKDCWLTDYAHYQIDINGNMVEVPHGDICYTCPIPNNEADGLPFLYAHLGETVTYTYLNVPINEDTELYIYDRCSYFIVYQTIQNINNLYGHQEKLYLNMEYIKPGETVYIDLELNGHLISCGNNSKYLEGRRVMLDQLYG